MRPEPGFERLEIDRTAVFVNLHRISSAERDMRTAFTAQVPEIAELADLTADSWLGRRDSGPFVGPQIPGEQGAPQPRVCSGEKLYRFGHRERRSQIDGGVQNASRVAGLYCPCGRFGKDAGETGGFSGENVHGGGVPAHSRGVYPGLVLLDRVVIQKVA